MSLSEAKSTLSNVGLSVDENRTDTPNGETDEVLSQNPAANTVAQRGTTVVLEVPSGKVTVPNVMSLSQADATTALSNQKLTPVVTMVTGDASEVGRVVNQDKAANSLVARGTTVTIKVVGEAAATPSDSPSQ
jgi:serine/threonine-protein kinase